MPPMHQKVLARVSTVNNGLFPRYFLEEVDLMLPKCITLVWYAGTHLIIHV